MSNKILGFGIFTNLLPNQLVGLKFLVNQILNPLHWCLWDDFSNQTYDQILMEKWNKMNIEFQSFKQA